MTATVAPAPVLLSLSTCDGSCPAAGQVRWRFRGGLDLVLCGHHSRRHERGLIRVGAFSGPLVGEGA